MELFTITCTTCKAKLKVRDVAAIGEILACPKCGSMVLVAAPEGWKPPKPEDALSETPPESGPIKVAADSSRIKRPSSAELPPGKTDRGPAAAAGKPSTNGDRKKAPRWQDEGPADGAGDRGDAAPRHAESAASGGRTGKPLSGAAAAFDYGDDESQSKLDAARRHRVPDAAAAATPTAAWIKWSIGAGAPLAAVGLIVGSWIMFTGSRREPAPDTAPLVATPDPPTGDLEPSPSVAQEPVAKPARVPLNPRWLPSAAEGMLSLRLGEAWRQPGARTVLDHTATLWNPALATWFAAFPFTPDEIRRLTWATTDLAAVEGDDWFAAGVVIVELERPVAERKEWIDGCETLESKLGSAPCRRVPAADWPHAFAVVDERTIVTGPAAVMQALTEREGPREAQTEFDRIVDRLDAGGELLWALDLAAVRADDAMPAWLPLVEMWHASHDDWHVVRELPLALGLGLRLGERLQIELLLAGDGESSAEQLEKALGGVVSAVEKTMSGEADGLTRKLLAGEITTADAGQLKLLFSATREALARRQFERDGPVVRLAADWRNDWSAVALAAVASVPELESRRLAAARVLDEDHHRQLLDALDGFTKAERSFPAGAAGAALFPPEDRLSWIATLLPYYDRLDWHGELSFGRPWNDATNARVTRRPLDLVVNPVLGPGQTKAGFPVTHYVGLAGLGADAGKLEIDDPRSGAFGYNRRATQQQFGDGASHTIALMGVSNHVGAWAAGGEATVRPLTAKPYINGPDGFGSGQPDGMLVGMADGSVRFLSKDIDPGVLERMATINGGESSLEDESAPDLADDPARMAETDVEPEPPRELKEPAEKVPAEDVAEVRPVPATPKRSGEEVTTHLADKIREIAFDKVPLADVVRILSDFSTLDISLDIEALAEMGIKPDAKVTLHLEEATVDEVLAATMAPFKLAYVVADGQVLITNPLRLEDSLLSRQFDVADLAGDDPAAADELAALVRKLVQPTAWQESGGRGRIHAAQGSLAVEQTDAIGQQVSLWLDKLRLARGLPLAAGSPTARDKGPRSNEELTLDTRYALARALLELPVTVNFGEPTPLAKIVAQLEKGTKAKLVFDGLALTEAGLSPQVATKLSVDRRPLSDALTAVLEPLRLAFRVVDARTLQITTRKAASERLEVEFHRVGDLLDEHVTAETLREQVLDELAPKSWSESGGPGVLHYDAASKCLIVLQSQGVQIELERMLEALRKAK